MAALHSSFRKESVHSPGHIPSSTLGRRRRPDVPSGDAPSVSETETDKYGFYVTAEEKAMEEAYIRQRPENLSTHRAWQVMLENWEKTSSAKKKKYCRAGVPQAVRRTVWPLLLNSYGCEFQSQEDYAELKSRDAKDPNIYNVIERDLGRTFPTHQLFAEPGGIGQQRLRGILRAYANLNPHVSYVQGMGFIAATLLLQIEDEESTFWAFVALMQRPKFALAQLFAPGFPALHVRFHQLTRLMQRVCKGLWRRMVTFQIDTAIYATNWYLTLFSCSLNFGLLSRIWDMFLCEGWKVIHRVAIAFLKLHRPLLERAKDQCDLLMALRSIQDGKDADVVLQTALKVKFKTAELLKWEKKYIKNQGKGSFPNGAVSIGKMRALLPSMLQEVSVFSCEEAELADDAVAFPKSLEPFNGSGVDASLSPPENTKCQRYVLQWSKPPEGMIGLEATNLPRGPYICSGNDSPSDTDSLGRTNGAASFYKGTSLTENTEEEIQEFVDEFGFVMDDEEIARELRYVRNIDEKRVVRRQLKWSTMASNWEKVNSKNPSKLKERCRKGIPSVFRGIAWQLLLGSHREVTDSSNKETFDSLRLKELKDSEVDETIRRDLARTFPKNILFSVSGGKQILLFNVLHAYASADPEVGYVQGMAFVVATLLTQMSEEEAFWALLMLMNGKRHNMRELFRPGFPLLQQYFFQLKKLMKRFIPKLFSRFEELEVEPSFYASQWFLTLFVYHFHFRVVLRIWDVFMSEGWKIIFRVAIALMKWEEPRLLQMGFDALLPALRTLHEGKDPDEVLHRAHKVKFKTSELNAYGEEYCLIQRKKFDTMATRSAAQ